MVDIQLTALDKPQDLRKQWRQIDDIRLGQEPGREKMRIVVEDRQMAARPGRAGGRGLVCLALYRAAGTGPRRCRLFRQDRLLQRLHRRARRRRGAAVDVQAPGPPAAAADARVGGPRAAHGACRAVRLRSAGGLAVARDGTGCATVPDGDLAAGPGRCGAGAVTAPPRPDALWPEGDEVERVAGPDAGRAARRPGAGRPRHARGGGGARRPHRRPSAMATAFAQRRRCSAGR